MRLCLSKMRCASIPTREEESVLWLGYYREILTCQILTVSCELVNLYLHLELRLWVDFGVLFKVGEQHYKTRDIVATQAWVPYT